MPFCCKQGVKVQFRTLARDAVCRFHLAVGGVWIPLLQAVRPPWGARRQDYSGQSFPWVRVLRPVVARRAEHVPFGHHHGC